MVRGRLDGLPPPPHCAVTSLPPILAAPAPDQPRSGNIDIRSRLPKRVNQAERSEAERLVRHHKQHDWIQKRSKKAVAQQVTAISSKRMRSLRECFNHVRALIRSASEPTRNSTEASLALPAAARRRLEWDCGQAGAVSSFEGVRVRPADGRQCDEAWGRRRG